MSLTINGYTLQDPPYEGGMALVYKGQKGTFTHAFKMVRPDKAANNHRLCQRFLKEIKLMSVLDHQNIIKIFDAYPYTAANGVTSTVLEMEWLDGMDLQRYVENRAPKGISIDQVKKIAMRIIDALEYAHRHSILHLDIKPSNIFRTYNGFIKVIDFGIARVVGENADIVEGAERVTMVTETGESTFKGTLAYASPEQNVGGKLGFYSDIFSFGRTLQFLCTGSADPSGEVSDPKVASIINKCTMQKPRDRYQNFTEVRSAFMTHDIQKCPHCRFAISTTVKFCPECGKPIHEPAPKPDKITCPKCGGQTPKDSFFCEKCGHIMILTIKGYKCKRCGKTTKQYTDGKVNFCNYCGAPKSVLEPQYT